MTLNDLEQPHRTIWRYRFPELAVETNKDRPTLCQRQNDSRRSVDFSDRAQTRRVTRRFHDILQRSVTGKWHETDTMADWYKSYMIYRMVSCSGCAVVSSCEKPAVGPCRSESTSQIHAARRIEQGTCRVSVSYSDWVSCFSILRPLAYYGISETDAPVYFRGGWTAGHDIWASEF